MKVNKYILPVRSDTIREIGKRGIKTLKKDETGIVRKDFNKSGSSAFGWGAVDDTIPVNKKELKDVKRNLNSIIQLVGSAAAPPIPLVEQEPTILPTGKRPAVIDLDEEAPAPVPKKAYVIPTLIEEWHNQCVENYDKGMLGFIPECYHSNGMPPLEEMPHTTVGQVLLNFSRFIKLLF